MKIISGYTENIKEISDISYNSYVDYCLKNCIELERHQIKEIERGPSWYKVQFILNEFNKGHEWVMWVDADTLLVNKNFDINQLIDKNSEVIISRDINGLNCGVMLWKKTTRTQEILKAIWDSLEFLNHPWWEQAAFIKLYDENFLDMQKFVKIVPQNQLNAYNYFLYGIEHKQGQLNANSIILQFPGLPYIVKLTEMQKFV
jgi:hypothetical protein